MCASKQARESSTYQYFHSHWQAYSGLQLTAGIHEGSSLNPSNLNPNLQRIIFYIYIYYVLLLLVVDFSIDNCDKMTIDVEGSVVNHTLILTINYCHCHCQILLSQEGLVSETPS